MIDPKYYFEPWPEQKNIYARFYQKTVALKDFKSSLNPKIKVASLKQIHSSEILTLLDDKIENLSPADGLVTKLDNIALTVHTADCLPLLAHSGEVIGSCHGGWRGVSKNIIEIWVAKMLALGAKRNDMRIAIGPAIGPCHFEVGVDVAREIVNGVPEHLLRTIVLPHPNVDKKFINLAELARFKLMRLGIDEGHISISRECTFCHSEKYYSFRRDGDKKGQRLEAIIVKGQH